MRLSAVAQQELEEILSREIGVGVPTSLTDEEVQDLGSRLLRLTAVILREKRVKNA